MGDEFSRHLYISDPGEGTQQKGVPRPISFPWIGMTHVKWKHEGCRADEV